MDGGSKFKVVFQDCSEKWRRLRCRLWIWANAWLFSRWFTTSVLRQRWRYGYPGDARWTFVWQPMICKIARADLTQQMVPIQQLDIENGLVWFFASHWFSTWRTKKVFISNWNDFHANLVLCALLLCRRKSKSDCYGNDMESQCKQRHGLEVKVVSKAVGLTIPPHAFVHWREFYWLLPSRFLGAIFHFRFPLILYVCFASYPEWSEIWWP